MEKIIENKMGPAPVKSLLLKMALPVVLSTAVQSLYNIVDGVFVSQLGENAMAAKLPLPDQSYRCLLH